MYRFTTAVLTEACYGSDSGFDPMVTSRTIPGFKWDTLPGLSAVS